MRQAIDVDQERGGGAVDGLRSDQFLDAQYKKTELRRRYRDNDAADRVGKLMRAIEQDVIPRLVSARQKTVEVPAPSYPARAIDAARVEQFARILLGQDTGVEPSSFVAAVRAEGCPVEAVYLNLLAPAARHVGLLWEEDLCTFVDVTLALGTLHRILLSLSDDVRLEPRGIDPARRLLLVQPSGSTHTFGLQMVAEFFRRGAWSVDIAPASTDQALIARVRSAWFTVIGFSVACDPDLDALVATIRSVRRFSDNPAVGILLGGPAVLSHPELVRRAGADGTAVDAIQAVLEAERFVLHTAAFSGSSDPVPL